MSEKKIMTEVLLTCPSFNSRLFRNNVGVLRDDNGNFIRYGLGVGSSDLIGFTRINITHDMVGRDIAVFTAVEIKKNNRKPHRSQTKQSHFINVIRESGGIALFATRTEDLSEAINEFKRKTTKTPD